MPIVAKTIYRLSRAPARSATKTNPPKVAPIFSPRESPCEDVIGARGDVDVAGIVGVVVDCLVVPFVAEVVVGGVFVVATELLV